MYWIGRCALFAACIAWFPVQAQQAAPDSLAELSRRLDVLAQEIERLNLGEAAATADVGQYGLGPAASKIYRTARGVSIGGYGEMVYNRYAGEKENGTTSGKVDQFDMLRAIIYVGYKYNENWLLNSEFEFEHATTGVAGSVSAEFVHVEYLRRPEFNLRFGLLLMPMGLVNELHEPTVFMGVGRPDIEQVIIPSTWRENGVGIFGEIGSVSYRTYLVNGMRGSMFSASGLRGGRQKGSKAQANHFGWTGRVDITPRAGLVIGGSAYAGYSGQDLTLGAKNLNIPTAIFEGHVDLRHRGLWISILGVRGHIGEALELNQSLGFIGNQSVGDVMQGFYAQAGYDVLAGTALNDVTLMPYVRYEKYNTQNSVPVGFSKDPSKDVHSITAGLSFYPESRIVFKADFKRISNEAKSGINQVNGALGYIF